MFDAVRFQRLPQKEAMDSDRKGALKCGAMFKPTIEVTADAGPAAATTSVTR